MHISTLSSPQKVLFYPSLEKYFEFNLIVLSPFFNAINLILMSKSLFLFHLLHLSILLAVLGTEPMPSHMPGKCSATEPQP